jgi:hypothetical protein
MDMETLYIVTPRALHEAKSIRYQMALADYGPAHKKTTD